MKRASGSSQHDILFLAEDEFLDRDGNLHRRYMKRGVECSGKNAVVGSVIRELAGGLDESLAPRFVAIL